MRNVDKGSDVQTTKMLRVLLADDQALLRGAFRTLLDSAPDITVVGEAGDGQEVIALTHELKPDVVLMDIRMPTMDGIAATSVICADAALRATHVLILTTYETDEYIAQALRAGASGFIGKGMKPQALFDAIRAVAGGETLLSPVATRSLVARFLTTPLEAPLDSGKLLAELTPREQEMVVLVAEGLSNVDIADRMYLSPFTVRAHVQRAMTKLDVRNRAQLVVIAYQAGIIRVGPNTRSDDV